MLRARAVLLVKLLAVVMAAVCAASSAHVSLVQATVTPTPGSPQKPREPDDWILLNNVPPGSPQIEYGREIYRLVCSACHGDKGQGLTTEWRMTWALADQNCW